MTLNAHGTNIRASGEVDNETFVRCDYCGARGPWANRANRAKVVWNARVLAAPPVRVTITVEE